jgi:AcrR family transcriptional regulator
VTDAHREARRAQIRTAAARAILAKGFHATSIADVVAEAGLSAGAIYTHYADKQELFAAVATELMSRREADVAVPDDGVPLPPSGVLEALVTGVRDDLDGLHLLVQLWAASTVDDGLHSLVQDVGARVRSIVAQALRTWYATHGLAPEAAADTADRLTPVVMGLAQGYIVQHVLLDDFDPEAYLTASRSVLPA